MVGLDDNLADRSKVPDYKHIYNIYKKERFWSGNGPDIIAKSIKYINKYNTETGGKILSKLVQVGNENERETIVCIVKELKLRVPKMIPQSGDIVIDDATSNVVRWDPLTPIADSSISQTGWVPTIQQRAPRPPRRGDDSLGAVGSSETICLPGLLLGLYKDYPSLSLVSLAIWRQIQPETEMMAPQSPAPRVPEAPNPLPNQLHPILAPKNTGNGSGGATIARTTWPEKEQMALYHHL